jgi:hypothetical protein
MVEAASPCPACGAPPRTTVGPRYEGARGLLWRRHAIEEQLFRCLEGHVYSVRVERRRSGEEITAHVWKDVEDWLRVRTGSEAPERPPGL